MYIFLINQSELDMLFHTGDGNEKTIKPNQRVSVACSEEGLLHLYTKHTYGSRVCEPEFQHGYEKLSYYMTLKQQHAYHMAVCSAYAFHCLSDMDEIILTHYIKDSEPHCYYHCFVPSCLPASMQHTIADSERIKKAHQKERRNLALWTLLAGFLLDAGLCSLGFWILVGVINITDEPNELPFWIILISMFFLIAFLPGLVRAIKRYRDDGFLFNMTSCGISQLIHEETGGIPETN